MQVAGSNPVGGFMSENPNIERKPLYQIGQLERGFTIKRDGYIDASVSIDGAILHIKYQEDGREWDTSSAIGDFRGLKNSIVSIVIRAWQKTKATKIHETRKLTAKQIKKHEEGFLTKGFKEWLEKSFAKGLTYALYPEWQRLVNMADPRISAVIKKFISVRGPKTKIPPVLMNPKAYKDENFVKDALAYNAVHLCLDNAEVIDGKVCYPLTDEIVYPRHRMTPYWRWCFSCIPGTYRALNKTLDNFPRSVPVHMAKILKEIRLTEPINDRVKIVAVCQAIASSRYARTNHLPCILRSSPEQIRRAFNLYRKDYYRQHPQSKGSVSLRKHQCIGNFICNMIDFPEPHHGGIVRLYERSHEWHNNRRWTIDQSIKDQDENTPTSKPIIPLPEDENIKFLSTIKEVKEEGSNMGHCIATYAHRAVLGSCYLFHTEHEGEVASTMVDSQGKVVQSFGPKNCVNKASAWAANRLGVWGKKIEDEWNKGLIRPQLQVQEAF